MYFTPQRKATLLQEYNQRFKSNKLVDRRIGEKDNALTDEDKMMKRYAKERLVCALLCWSNRLKCTLVYLLQSAHTEGTVYPRI